jgi:hypothetical protein
MMWMHAPHPAVASFSLVGFAQWSKARNVFFARLVKARMVWSPALTNNVYSTQLWQLLKTREMMQEFALEGRGRELYGFTADSRTWCNTIPAETSPSAVHIREGPVGIGGSALTNKSFTASWYELLMETSN